MTARLDGRSPKVTVVVSDEKAAVLLRSGYRRAESAAPREIAEPAPAPARPKRPRRTRKTAKE